MFASCLIFTLVNSNCYYIIYARMLIKVIVHLYTQLIKTKYFFYFPIKAIEYRRTKISTDSVRLKFSFFLNLIYF